MRKATTCFLVLWMMAACQPSGPVFDTAAWQAARPASAPTNNARLGMADALVSQHLRLGMSRQSVHSLLGKPDYVEALRDRWDIGFAPMRMDMSSLIVDYDPAQAVRAVKVQEN